MEIKNTLKEYHSTNTLVYSCQYHIIWTTKYRRKVLTDTIRQRIKEMFLSKQKEWKFKIIEMEIMSDHVHLLIDQNPQLDICSLIAKLKGYTAHEIRKEFPYLKSKLPCLWTRSKFISTVGSVSLEIVKKYIEDQKNK